MGNPLKKATLVAALAAFVLTQAVAPRPAQAVVGIVDSINGNAPVGIDTYVLLGIVGGPTLPCYVFDQIFIETHDGCHWSPGAVATTIVLLPLDAVLAVLGGLVLLDGSPHSGQVQFAPLQDASARQLAITPDEQASFNSEIDELNAEFQSVSAQLAAGHDRTLDASRALWDEAGRNLSPGTMAAARKIVQGWISASNAHDFAPQLR